MDERSGARIITENTYLNDIRLLFETYFDMINFGGKQKNNIFHAMQCFTCNSFSFVTIAFILSKAIRVLKLSIMSRRFLWRVGIAPHILNLETG